MADDWIKMRGALNTNPKVLLIAMIVGESKAIGRKLSTGFNGVLHEIVTRDVTRDVTLASLMRVWCAANEHTQEGIWKNATLEMLDQIAGLPGFGAAMVEVGWAVHDPEKGEVTFPNFLEYNAPSKNGARSSNAERQRRYREKKATERNGKRNVTRNATRDVTRNARREESITPIVPAGFTQFVSKYPTPRINSKRKALAIWQRDKLEPIAATIVAHVERMASTPDWQREAGKYVPNITTYLNDARWETPSPQAQPSRLAI